jgi:ankyrin repeat protein
MQDIIDVLENGYDVNQADHIGFTALMGAAKSGNIELLKLLIKYGAHINLKDHNHFTALHYATLHNQLEAVKVLVENGAIIDDKIYMTSIYKEHKKITLYFDSLDQDKQIFKYHKQYRRK